MNIDAIRNKIITFLNVECSFLYCLGRGQYEKFDGYINKIYSRIFTIKADDGRLRAVSYSDYAIKNLKINLK